MANNRAKKSATPGKHPGGRPTDYLARYCKEVVEFLGQGYSLTAFAGRVGVSRETIYTWAETIPEFSGALAKAKAARTLYWETRLNVATKDSRAVIFALRNSCSEEWKNDPDIQLNIHNEVKTDLNKPVEEWGEAEFEAELRKRGVLVPKATNGHIKEAKR